MPIQFLSCFSFLDVLILQFLQVGVDFAKVVDTRFAFEGRKIVEVREIEIAVFIFIT